MEKMLDLDLKIKEMAGRIRELRDIVGLSVKEMAEKTEVSVEEYKDYAGKINLTKFSAELSRTGKDLKGYGKDLL